MKTDVIIVGTELDGLIAATRLHEHGYSVRIFSNGAGSLNYAPDGIHVLGFLQSATNDEWVVEPFSALARLDKNHPYQKMGADQLGNALDWYINRVGVIHQPVTTNGRNRQAVSAAGLRTPVYATARNQATFEKISGKTVAIVRFQNYQNSPTDLICAQLASAGITTNIIDLPAPREILENAALAKAFDALEHPNHYFAAIKETIPVQTEVILFPAIMGLLKNHEILNAAEHILGVPCLEVPTLPPSIPGMRLEQAFSHRLKTGGVSFNTGARIARHAFEEKDQIVVWDDMGRRFEASVVVVASGGVLMGGLEVDSYGRVYETVFGLPTFQSEPLRATSVDQSLNDLHFAGVETDHLLRPHRNGAEVYRNVFVTGRTLAHWNPSAESSAEGGCIATGWSAAEHAHNYLRAVNNE